MIPVGTVINGRYRIDQQIGQGGMGVIYQATHLNLNVPVALKQFTGTGDTRAFLQEAQLLARLSHQYIVRVMDSFEENHHLFLVMEWVDGTPINQYLQNHTPTIEQIIRWALELNDALIYLHTRTPPVIHRDIKPGNVMIVEDEIKLIDFGIAKGGELLTRSIQAGTIAYASLEQIQGAPTDPRSDIFSAAATLYHLATGQAPLDSLSRNAVISQGYPDPIKLPTLLVPTLPNSLSHAIMQGLALDPNNRPANIASWKPMFQQAQQSIAGSTQSTVNLGNAVSSPTIALQQTSPMAREHTQPVWTVAWHPQGQIVASCSDDGTINFWSRDGQLLTTLIGHLGGVIKLLWSPNGAILASIGKDNMLRFWNSNGQLFSVLQKHTQTIISAVWSHDSTTFVSASRDKNICIWSNRGQLVDTIYTGVGVAAVAWNGTSDWFTSLNEDKTLKLWNQKGDFIAFFAQLDKSGTTLQWSPDNKILAVALDDYTIQLWDRSRSLIKTLKHHQNKIVQLAWSPDGDIVAAASYDKTISLWRKDGDYIKVIRDHNGLVETIAWTPDGLLLASGASDDRIFVWDRTGVEVAFLSGHRSDINSIAWSPDGTILASASFDCTVRLWSKTGQLLHILGKS